MPFRFVLLFVLIVGAGRAQTLVPFDEAKYTDSLKNHLTKTGSDSEKMSALLLLADYYRNFDKNLSSNYLKEAKPLAKPNTFNEGKYYFFEGQFKTVNDKENAAESFRKSIAVLEKLKTKEADELLSSAWYNYGITQKNKEGYPYLIKLILEKSIPLVEKHQNQKKLGHLYSQLGIIFTYNAEFGKAKTYLDRALQLLEKNAPASPELFYTYLNLVSNYCFQAQGDAAKTQLDKAEKIISGYPHSSANPLFIYHKALYEITKEKNDLALITLEEGIKSAKKFNQNQLLQMFYMNKYDILKKQKRFADAKQVLVAILNEKTLLADASNRKTIFKEAQTLNEIMGDHLEALIWSKKYAALSDSLHESKTKLEINNLEAKFNTSEKEKQLAQQELELNTKNQYMWILGIASLFFLSYGIFAFFTFKNKKKLAEQREIILSQKLKEAEQKEQLKVTKAILDGEERERQRVAKDLHDGLGGMLAGVKFNLSTWSSNNLESAQVEDFHKILNQLDNSVSELRRVARNLMPESLLNFGLEVALKDLCESYMNDTLQIDFQPMNIERDLSLNTQLNIYRIVQELLSNAVKHSGASNILLQCAQSENQFYITVEDNGKGILVKDRNKMKSMGLKNLQSRVEYLKGKMEILAEANEGTSINIELATNAVA